MHLKGLRWKFIKNIHWKFSRSLQWKLVAIFILITIFLMIIIWLFLINSIESTYYNNFKSIIESGIERADLSNDEKITFDQLKRELIDNRNATVYFLLGNDRDFAIINKNLKIEYYPDSNDASLSKEILKSKNFIKALSGNKGDDGSLLHGDNGSPFYDYAIPIGKGEFILYFKYYRLGEIKHTIDEISKGIAKSSFFAVILSLLIGYALSKTITIPVVNIMHKAQKLSEGDFDHLLEVKSDDEIGKLTKTFNVMARELKQTLIGISSEKNKVETILKYMTDGVIAFNFEGEVIHANPISLKMLGLLDDNMSFDEFSQRFGLGIKLEDQLVSDPNVSYEKIIQTNSKTIKVYFALFTDEENKVEGVIAVLQDITEQQKLEEMRKEFVANVSHELRTPLTSIKSYAETLLDGEFQNPEVATEFLGVINSEADRMTRLVKDLLELSRLDSNKMKWKMSRVSLTEIVLNSVNKLKIEANNKKQALEFFVVNEPGEINADRDRIEQVVLNIISNSIKYTHEKGIITVCIDNNGKQAIIKVSDTGIGIPKDELTRVFERFFRVDKARSREMGGTGLGLAIAKEIVEAHGGTIMIDSELGKGTEVVMMFNKV